MTKIKVVQGDKGYEINFTLQDANGVAYDITAGTLLLKVQKVGASTTAFSGSMAIVSAVNGTCKYTVASGNFGDAGQYYGEIEATFDGGAKVVTWSDIVFVAEPQLPR
jgi:hypothetical protein